MDQYIQDEMKRQHIPGLSLAMVQSGKVVAAQSYGLANLELNVPATPDTAYQIGSLTKQFTAAAIMMLAEEGKVKLDTLVAEYQEGLPNIWSGVTVRHLLNHTSGIINFTSHADFAEMQHSPTNRTEILALLADEPLEFTPGTSYAYSNTGYYLLGHVIESASSGTYADFLQTRIFQPLQMNATRVGDWQDIIPNRASGYRWKEDKWSNAEYFSLTWAFSAGAIVSTALDLARWNIAQCNETFLPKNTWEQMWTPATLSDGSRTEYGFGWGIGEHEGRHVLGHGGAAPGFTAFTERAVADELTVIVLTNIIPSETAKIARNIANRFLSQS